MYPFIINGDMVVIESGTDSLAIGKIAAFFLEDQLIMHRVIWIKKRSRLKQDVWTRGDSSPGSLSRISSESIIGTVIGTQNGKKIKKIWCAFPSSLISIVAGGVISTGITVFRNVSRKPS